MYYSWNIKSTTARLAGYSACWFCRVCQPVYLYSEAPTCSESELLDGTWLAGMSISGYLFFVGSTFCHCKNIILYFTCSCNVTRSNVITLGEQQLVDSEAAPFLY
ncbi:hypothetical protein Y032_0003g1639 [Ancylostoma ceylanicum]|uniref:Uncharacterized protein n=1 Tax=Ancylostoma ceylanicum TaxID=53326 RepID=A0A016VYV3_9BILA|nr:hypothetical protein Y032_0003g1639 [Ancylostoma ceylanicum]